MAVVKRLPKRHHRKIKSLISFEITGDYSGYLENRVPLMSLLVLGAGLWGKEEGAVAS